MTEFYKRSFALNFKPFSFIRFELRCPYLTPAQNSILTFCGPKVKHFLHQRNYATVLGVAYNISKYFSYEWIFFFAFSTFRQFEIADVFQLNKSFRAKFSFHLIYADLFSDTNFQIEIKRAGLCVHNMYFYIRDLGSHNADNICLYV